MNFNGYQQCPPNERNGQQRSMKPSESCSGFYPPNNKSGGMGLSRNGSYSSMPNQGTYGYIAQRPQQQSQGQCGYQQPTAASKQRQQQPQRPSTASYPQQQQMMQQPLMMSQMQAMKHQLRVQQQQFENRKAQGQSSPAAQNLYSSTPCQPVMVNISAATLANAKNTPAVADRGESSMEGNPGVKYIPLSWEDILGKGGMNSMQVSMAPAGGDPGQNRQLKIAFGGKGCPQEFPAGDTPLKVLSFQPVSSSGLVEKNPMSQMMPQLQMAPRKQSGGQQGSFSSGKKEKCGCSNCQQPRRC